MKWTGDLWFREDNDDGMLSVGLEYSGRRKVSRVGVAKWMRRWANSTELVSLALSLMELIWGEVGKGLMRGLRGKRWERVKSKKVGEG